MNNQDIGRPWGIANGVALGLTVYFLTAGGLLYLSWRWALGQGWPPWPPARSAWGWAQWVLRSWGVDQGQQWLAPARFSAALASLAPAPLAALAAWWIARPGPSEIHLKGRRLSADPRQAGREAIQECKIAGEGLLIHPQIPLSLDRETRHVLVVGGTGGGKTVMMLPLIQQAIARPGDKLLINDSKNEFVEKLKRAAGAKGFITFSPWDDRCLAWDIASDITNKADARTIAARLVPQSDKDPMWGLAAQSILVSVFCKYQQTKPRDWDLQDVLTDVFSGYENLREIVMQYNREGLYAVEDIQKTKTTQSFLITLSTFLSQVSDLAEAWKGKQKISLRRWLLDPESPEYRNPSCKYILMGGNKRYAKLEQAYTQSIISALASIVNSPEMPDSNERKLWLFLDECPQLGEISELSQFFEIGRSKGCRVVVGTQDISQLRKIYGKDTAEAWTSMAGTYLIGRTGGRDTQKWLSELIGSRKLKKYRISYTREPGASDVASGRQDAWEEIEEPVVRPEEFSTTLGRRPNGMECLYLPGGDTVYRLIWPFPPKTKIRPVLVPSPWTESPRPADVDQAGEGGPAILAEEMEKPTDKQEKQQAAVVVEEQRSAIEDPDQEQHSEEPETPGEIVADELAEEAADALVDEALPGAGAAIQAAELVALVQGATVDEHKNKKLVIKHETEAEIWLEDELED